MIRIVLAEDQKMLLGVMGSLLNLEEDMEVVGMARDGAEAIILVQELQPDVCIMDVEMPKMSGLEAAEVLMSAGCQVIMVTTFARNGYVERAMKAGVRGYLLKDSPSKELVCSIRSIMDGERIYSPELIDHQKDGIEEAKDPHVTQKKLPMVKKYISTILNKMKWPIVEKRSA
jgi:two-component system response regulator DesR